MILRFFGTPPDSSLTGPDMSKRLQKCYLDLRFNGFRFRELDSASIANALTSSTVRRSGAHRHGLIFRLFKIVWDRANSPSEVRHKVLLFVTSAKPQKGIRANPFACLAVSLRHVDPFPITFGIFALLFLKSFHFMPDLLSVLRNT